MVRDPVERAISQYFHEIRLGLIRKWSLEEALEKNNSYIYKGFYSYFLKRYQQYFSSENIKVILFDDIKNKPAEVLKGVYKFLGLQNRGFLPDDFDKKVNPQRVSGFWRLNSFMIRSEYLLMRLGLDGLLQLLEDSGFRFLALKLRDGRTASNTRNKGKKQIVFPTIKEDTKKRIYHNYKWEIPELEKILGADLSAWKKYERHYQ